MDFDDTVQTGTIQPSTARDSLSLTIPITDDNIDEPEEGFILILEVIATDSVDSVNLQVNRNVLLGIIDDDDNESEYN